MIILGKDYGTIEVTTVTAAVATQIVGAKKVCGLFG
jgi:hypothetical protein